MIEETLGNGLKMHYDYDRSGRVIKIGLPDDTGISHSYVGHRLSAINRLAKNETIEYRHAYEEFDLSGNVLHAKLIGKAGPLKQRYDLLHRNIETTHKHRSENSFLYDKAGNLLKKNINDFHGIQPHNYTYDALDQLLTETGFSQHAYNCDSLYNRVEKDGKSHKVNRLNQLLNDGEQELSYDPSGNLEKIVHESSEIHFTYDALNRLTQHMGSHMGLANRQYVVVIKLPICKPDPIPDPILCQVCIQYIIYLIFELFLKCYRIYFHYILNFC